MAIALAWRAASPTKFFTPTNVTTSAQATPSFCQSLREPGSTERRRSPSSWCKPRFAPGARSTFGGSTAPSESNLSSPNSAYRDVAVRLPCSRRKSPRSETRPAWRGAADRRGDGCRAGSCSETRCAKRDATTPAGARVVATRRDVLTSWGPAGRQDASLREGAR